LVRCCLSVVSLSDTPTCRFASLSLHDALPICAEVLGGAGGAGACAQGAAAMMERQERAEKHIRSRRPAGRRPCARARSVAGEPRSEEHTSELQSRENLVCRPLLDKTNNR